MGYIRTVWENIRKKITWNISLSKETRSERKSVFWCLKKILSNFSGQVLDWGRDENEVIRLHEQGITRISVVWCFVCLYVYMYKLSRCTYRKFPKKKKKNNCLCSSLHGWINCYESWLCSKIILLLSCTRACFFVKSFNKKIKFKAKKKFNDNITRYNCLWFISVACFSYPITRLSMLLLLLLLLLHIFFIIIIIIVFFRALFAKQLLSVHDIQQCVNGSRDTFLRTYVTNLGTSFGCYMKRNFSVDFVGVLKKKIK